MMFLGFNRDATRYIIANMRDIDRREIYGMREPPRDDPDVLLDDVCTVSRLGPMMTWFASDGEPVAVNGAWRRDLFTADVWAFGTPRWREIVKPMTRHALRVMVPWLLSEGFQRAECLALAERADTRRWLPRLGMRQETVLAEVGHQRQDYVLYAWKPDHVLQHGERRRARRATADGLPEAGSHRGPDAGNHAAGAPQGGG